MSMSDKLDLHKVIHSSLVKVVPGRFAVAKVQDAPSISSYFLIAKDSEETTVVVEEKQLDALNYQDINKWFKLVEVAVSLPFYAVGLLAAITTAIAQKGLSVLVVSTFSKDYLLIREQSIDVAIEALSDLGFPIGTT